MKYLYMKFKVSGFKYGAYFTALYVNDQVTYFQGMILDLSYDEKLNFISVVAEGELGVLQTFTEDFNDKSSDAYKKLTADFSTVVFMFIIQFYIVFKR